MPIQITAKRNGFRRCGIAHSEHATLYADDHFTPEQLAELKAEPMLIVLDVNDADSSDIHAELAQAKARIAELEAGLEQMSADADALQQQLQAANATIERLTAAQSDEPKAGKK
ncbi:TPA: HI1506-related protein [Shigella sonnei]|nr:hypothetical protein [Shigella sonnei]